MKLLNAYIQPLFLQPDGSLDQLEQCCAMAARHGFPAISVPPLMVRSAKQFLGDAPVRVSTPVGYPYGYSAIEAKVSEVVLAIIDGADEIAWMSNTMAIKNNDWQYLAGELTHAMRVLNNQRKPMTVILETSLLTHDELVKCCDLYGVAGVDFIHTGSIAITEAQALHTTEQLRLYLSDQTRIIASGDIKTRSFAHQLLDAGADRLAVAHAGELMESAI